MMDLNSILGERLAIVGGTGSGKSYTARGLVERVLAAGGRVGVVDPTGVWHGLRVKADGKSAAFPVVIFGGDRSDVPLIETAGRVIAQAVAGTHQSWVIDTSALKTKAAERRFMLDFLDSLFEHNREEITLVVDEADRFSPQRMTPETARLHERMEEIVRRGRVRGFTPWLITQRPASLNKDVLSQATAMISLRMTGVHDRKAMADVLEGQADKDDARKIVSAMPNHTVGRGLVWAPQQGVLEAVHFPKITTLDTMRAPKPGEHRHEKALPPIDLGALREKLQTVETEAKANDPKELRLKIAALQKELAAKPTALGEASKEELANAGAEGWHDGHRTGLAEAWRTIGARTAHRFASLDEHLKEAGAIAETIRLEIAKEIERGPVAITTRPVSPPPTPRVASVVLTSQRPAARPNGHISSTPAEGLSRPQQRILDALSWLESIGIPQPTRTQLALWAEVSPTSGGYFNNLGSLRTAALIDYPAGGTVVLTDAGRQAANATAPPTTQEMQDMLCAKVGNAKAAILRAVIDAYPKAISRDDLATQIGVSPTSGGYFNNLGALRTLGVIDYPQKGHVAAQAILFVE